MEVLRSAVAGIDAAPAMLAPAHAPHAMRAPAEAGSTLLNSGLLPADAALSTDVAPARHNSGLLPADVAAARHNSGLLPAEVAAARHNSADVGSGMPEDPELTSLRAQVARLEAEREALQWAAGHDELTGLPNRRLFKTLATRVIDTAAETTAVMVLDLDGFKPINDRFGHATGDHVLRIIASRLAAWAGDNLVARLGGDEFAVLLTSCPKTRTLAWRSAVWTLAALIAQPIHLGCQAVSVTASIGIAPCNGAPAIAELLHHADIAMYRAKQHTKNTGISGTACVYHPSLLSRERMQVASQPVILELTIVKVKRDGPPTWLPAERDPAGVPPADTYSVGDPVWVHRHGAWRPGVIEGISSRAILARYRPSDGPGTGVDTVDADHVASR